MRQIQSQEVLPVGTEVFVGEYKGIVVSGALVPSSNNAGLIALHEIKKTHKRDFFGKFKLMDEENQSIQGCNYSFIFIKDSGK